MPLNFFKKRQGRPAPTAAAARLVLEASAILGADDETVVRVGADTCDEPGCCGTRTVVLVFREGHPSKAVKIEKAIESVTRADLVEALAPLLVPPHQPEAQPQRA